MTTYYEDATVQLHHGDCLDVLRGLPDNSVDSVVTDPPYGLEFMGKEWDAPWKQGADVHAEARTMRADEMGDENKRRFIASSVNKYAAGLPFQQWCELWATECLRVLKPGGHLLAFGGTRTWHRLACAVEDAGFEVRDSIAWMYGSGFPKSLDVSKAIDKAAGAEREVTGRHIQSKQTRTSGYAGEAEPFGAWQYDLTAPATDAARTWQGWGTALKPAFEPVVVARKPLGGSTVAANVLAWGTGALNIDGCRVEHDEPEGKPSTGMHGRRAGIMGETIERHRETTAASTAGRWPANVVLDESQAARLDEMSGECSHNPPATWRGGTDATEGWGNVGKAEPGQIRSGFGDSGGASRFFYVAKADASERPFIFRPTCECEDAWPTSAARATAATTSPESLSTSKHGNVTTVDPSQMATRSTTSTATSSTTTTTTSSQSPPPTTSASTPGANSETASGGSHAASVASSSASAPVTGTSAAKGGRSTADAVRAISRGWSATSVCGNCGAPSRREAHATVKPLALMRWLVRLVTPPGGTVLEPFAGSGTTVEACILEGFHCVAIEREADYLPLIVQRINRRRDPVAAVIAQGDDAGLFDLLDGEPA